MIWPDGGTGRPHKHPLFRPCQECLASPGFIQFIAMLAFNPFTISIFLLILLALLRGA